MRYLVAALLFLWTGAAMAQNACGPRAEIRDYLASRYSEVPDQVGSMENSGGVVELYTTADGSTWTLVVTRGDMSCLIAAGQSWQAITRMPIEQES